MYRTKEQNVKLHALIGKLKIDAETKADMVYECTGGRTKSSADMLINECADMIGKLQEMADGKPAEKKNNSEACNKMRRKILSSCYEMQWTLAGKLDWHRLNNWLLKYGYKHKKLDDYTEEELPTLVTQFEKLLNTYLNNL